MQRVWRNNDVKGRFISLGDDGLVIRARGACSLPKIGIILPPSRKAPTTIVKQNKVVVVLCLGVIPVDRICNWRGVWKEEIARIEDPFFAQSIVRDLLQRNTQLTGLSEFLQACGLPTRRALLGDEIKRASRAVGEGRWFLIRDDVRYPIDVSSYPSLRWAPSKADCQRHECIDEEPEGAGKWSTFSIDSDLIWSSAAFAANFLTSRGDEGRLFASEGKDYANTKRVVSQRWVPLEANERDLARLSAVHRYGTVRKITQYFVEAGDEWAITGHSWHWRPVVADSVYEFREGAY